MQTETQASTQILRISETLRLLEKRKEELESELLLTKWEIEKSHRELAKHGYKGHANRDHMITASPQPTTSIRRLPVETLSAIFEEYIMDRPLRVFTLLSVCKLWYTVAIEYPCLWRHIEISFKTPEVDSVRPVYDYVSTCLTRSQNLPLHININFLHWRDKEEWVRSKINRLFQEISGFTDSEVELYTRGYYGAWNRRGYPPYEEFDECCRSLIELISNRRQNNVIAAIDRLECLEVIFPKTFWSPYYLTKMVDQDMPKLRKLSLHRWDSPTILASRQQLPKFPDLEELDISCAFAHLSSFAFNLKLLTSLKIRDKSIPITTLGQCISLNTLELRGIPRDWSIPGNGGVRLELSLPNLDYLGIHGVGNVDFLVDFHFPLLKHFSIWTGYQTRVSAATDLCKLPKLIPNPEYVTWIVEPFGREEWIERGLLEGVAIRILKEYPEALSLEVDEFNREVAENALKSAQKKGECLSTKLVVKDLMLRCNSCDSE